MYKTMLHLNSAIDFRRQRGRNHDIPHVDVLMAHHNISSSNFGGVPSPLQHPGNITKLKFSVADTFDPHLRKV